MVWILVAIAWLALSYVLACWVGRWLRWRASEYAPDSGEMTGGGLLE